jgi:hypothetical protein
MRRTVIGVLEDEAEGRAVLVELGSLGVPSSNVDILSGAEEQPIEESTAKTTTVYHRKGKEGFGQKIANFFRSFIAPSDADVAADYEDDQVFYAEELDRGRLVMIVRDVDVKTADEVCRALGRQGGHNISLDVTPEAASRSEAVPRVTSPPPGTTRPTAVPSTAAKDHRPPDDETHLTASERTEGRVYRRRIRTYDQANLEAADLSEPKLNTASGTSSDAKRGRGAAG